MLQPASLHGHHLLALALMASVASPLVAQETAPLDAADAMASAGPDNGAEAMPVTTLVEALQHTWRDNPNLLASRAQALGSAYGIAVARSRSGPSITYEGRYGYDSNNTQNLLTGKFRRQTGWSSTASAILTQPVYTFGRNALELKAAKAQADYQDAVSRSTESQILLEAMVAYVEVIRDRNDVAIAEDYLRTLEHELADNSERLAKREVTSTDVQQTQTRVELAREQLLAARNQLTISEAQFIQVVGARPGQLTQPNPLVAPADSIETAYTLGEQWNPVIQAAYARERISHARHDALRAEYLPRVDLRGTAEYGSVTPYTDAYRQTILRGEVVVSGTLFDSGVRRARLQESSAINDADWRLIDAALRENRAQVADAWSAWITQRAATEHLQLAINAAQKAYDGAVIQERAGLRTTLDVLDLARDLLTAERNYNTAAAGAFVGQAKVLAAIGAINQRSLLPDEPGPADTRAFRNARSGGGIPGLSFVLLALDATTISPIGNREVRDASAGVKAEAPETSVDLSPELTKSTR